ncbi:MAG TPA: phytase, partial [Candidatus Luteimonas excrementigallinarum]|nr:phytase [Candidatus Luteimonas excrementigallinarum]
MAGVSLLALALAACAQQEVATPAGADDTADSAALGPVLVNEAFATPMTPDDNIDSVASWSSPDGDVLVLATAKSTHRLVVYDGFTGEFVRHVGEP